MNALILFLCFVPFVTCFDVNQQTCKAVYHNFDIERLVCKFHGDGVYNFDGFQRGLKEARVIEFDRLSSKSLLVLKSNKLHLVRVLNGEQQICEQIIVLVGSPKVEVGGELCMNHAKLSTDMTEGSTYSYKTTVKFAETTTYHFTSKSDPKTTTEDTGSSEPATDGNLQEKTSNWFTWFYPVLIALADACQYIAIMVIVTLVLWIEQRYLYRADQPLPQIQRPIPPNRRHRPVHPRNPAAPPHPHRYPRRARQQPDRFNL